MNNLFEQLGKLAQQATGGQASEMFGKVRDGLAGNTSPLGDLGNMGTTASDAFGKLKDAATNTNLAGSLGGVGGLLGAGALGGILGVLMGGKGLGKTLGKVGKGALMVGGTAAAAGLAWKLYQKWSATQPTAQPGTMSAPAGAPHSATGNAPLPLPSAQADPAGLLVLEAMVFAARADGHLDDNERRAIHETMNALFPGTDVATCVDGLMNRPLNPQDLARRVQDREQAMDVYRLSRLVISVDHPMERAYLESLAEAFGLTDAERLMLDDEVEQLRQA